MIHLLFLGDGPRDEAIMPPMVGGILNREAETNFLPWRKLHTRGKGYGPKLKYARRRASDHGLQGLVAIVDTDRTDRRARLRSMREAREDERAAGHDLPIAVGEATPHTEAWLLDDAQAVRSALSLGEEADVPSVRNLRDAKGALESLLRESPRREDAPRTVWADIASEMDLGRCGQANRTGFAAFAKDIEDELGSLAEA